VFSRNNASGSNIIVLWSAFLFLFLKIPGLSPASAAGYSTGFLRLSSDYKTCGMFTLNYGVFASPHILSIFLEHHSSISFPFSSPTTLQPFDVQKHFQLRKCPLKKTRIKSPPLVHILRLVATNLDYTCLSHIEAHFPPPPFSESEVNGRI
jgi:hypothetical protein